MLAMPGQEDVALQGMRHELEDAPDSVGGQQQQTQDAYSSEHDSSICWVTCSMGGIASAKIVQSQQESRNFQLLTRAELGCCCLSH